jgi:hypothetical protein
MHNTKLLSLLVYLLDRLLAVALIILLAKSVVRATASITTVPNFGGFCESTTRCIRMGIVAIFTLHTTRAAAAHFAGSKTQRNRSTALLCSPPTSPSMKAGYTIAIFFSKSGGWE